MDEHLQKILRGKITMRPIKTITYLIILMATGSAIGAVHYVPQEYATIQAAVNASNNLDIIVVAPARYAGVGNRNINLYGRQIAVQSSDPNNAGVVSSTIIDCEGKNRGFVFYTGETGSSIIRGFTITGGYGLLGGAFYCYNNSSPSIANCVITGNSAVLGGAIACANSKTYPKISNCKITANSASVGGGAIYCNGASPVIKSCVINGNFAPDGGAIYSHNADNPAVINCTISGNAASKSAGAIYCYNSSKLTLNNDILWSNTAVTAPDLYVSNAGAAASAQLSYCNVRNSGVVSDSGCVINWGSGNINADPRFAGTGTLTLKNTFTGADFHLLKGSGCIDAGSPAYVSESGETDIDGKPRISGAKIDIGAYEFQQPIQAAFEIHPETLNLESNGQWVSGIISSIAGYSISDIDTASMVLNDTIKPESVAVEDGKMLLKFSRSKVQEAVSTVENEAVLNIAGKLNNGKDFAGSDTIRIIRPGGKK